MIESINNGISNFFDKVFFSSLVSELLGMNVSNDRRLFFEQFKKKHEPTTGELLIHRAIQKIAEEQKKSADLVPELLKLLREQTVKTGLTYSALDDHYKENSEILESITENTELQFFLRDERLKTLEGLVNSYDDKIAQSVLKVMASYERRFKNGLLDEIIGDSSTDNDYARSETYEREKYADKVKEQERDLDRRSFELGVKEELQEQRSTVQNVRTEMVRGFTAHEMKFVEMGAAFTEKLSGITENISSLREYFAEKMVSLNERITEETTGIKGIITALKYDLKTDVTDLKVQFNGELVRLDKQQNSIVSQLEIYEAQMLGFANQVDRLKIEAQTYSLKGQEMLNRAENIYQHHKAELRLIKGELQQGLKLVAVHKEDFANSVGRARIMMDKVAQDQYHAMKDIAYEKMGVEMLRQDYSTRVENETLKLREIQTNIQTTQRLIEERSRSNQQVAGLQHQLFMSQEKEAYSSQRLGLLQQENALIRRLDR